MLRKLAAALSLAMLVPLAAKADVVLATRTIRAQTIVSPEDIVVKSGDVLGAASRAEEVIGLETRVALYAGRPIRTADLGPPAVIERNQIVQLVYQRNGLSIAAEGRSLSRAGPGERVRAMNLSSRMTVSGWAGPDGRVIVSK